MIGSNNVIETKIVDITSTKTNTISAPKLNVYLKLERKTFVDEKDKQKFIKNVERIIRSSKEYKEWIKFVKYTLEHNKCVFTNETDEETGDIEIHHHPFTLYDLVEVVIDNKLKNGEEFTSFQIAQEVLELHFNLRLGFVPLIGTLHKKYHRGYLDIPPKYVSGNWKYVVDNYELNDRLKEKLSIFEQQQGSSDDNTNND